MSSENNMPVLVLSVTEAQRRNIFGMEREAATNIMKVVEQNNSNLVLDDLTAADGNCMITGIIQQCQRDDIYPHLPAHIQNLVRGPITVDKTNEFRFAVCQFLTENDSLPAVQNIRSFVENWEQYLMNI